MTFPADNIQLVLAINSTIEVESIRQCLSTGKIACVILYDAELNSPRFEEFCKQVVPLAQAENIAALIAEDTQIMGRCGADGLYLEREASSAKQIIARFSPQKIVGIGGLYNRHNAMIAGELGPDFVLFGKLAGDIRPDSHPKCLKLAGWWSQLVEVPCVVTAGNSLSSIEDCANSGAEFIALEQAVFGADIDASIQINEAVLLLERYSTHVG